LEYLEFRILTFDIISVILVCVFLNSRIKLKYFAQCEVNEESFDCLIKQSK